MKKIYNYIALVVIAALAVFALVVFCSAVLWFFLEIAIHLI